MPIWFFHGPLNSELDWRSRKHTMSERCVHQDDTSHHPHVQGARLREHPCWPCRLCWNYHRKTWLDEWSGKIHVLQAVGCYGQVTNGSIKSLLLHLNHMTRITSYSEINNCNKIKELYKTEKLGTNNSQFGSSLS